MHDAKMYSASARALPQSARHATADHHPCGGTIGLSPQGTPSAMGNQRRKVRVAPATKPARCMVRKYMARVLLGFINASTEIDQKSKHQSRYG